MTKGWINQWNIAENPELDAFVYEKLIYDKNGSLIQREMNGLFIKCTSKFVINLKKKVETDTPYYLLLKKELPDIVKT